MPNHTRSVFAPSAAARAAALLLGLCLALPTLASGDGHGSAKDEPPAKAEKPAAKAAEKADKVAAAQDPMDALREKLAAKLGAANAKPAEAKSSNVVRVVSKAESGHGTAATAAAKPRGEAKPDLAQVVAALRAEKQGAAGHGGNDHAAHWSYAGEGGPESWGALKPEFAKCGNGQRQSPIDIRGGVRVDLDPIQFDYRPTGFRVVDNGHTVQVNLGSGNSIEVLGRRYELVQFHFHRPSEERIDGRQFDMVAHLVHKDVEGRLAVVAVLLDRGSVHPLVQTVWNNLPLEKGEEVPAKTALDLNGLLPQDRRYYTYMGSLTTPPCTEGVLWMVMQQPVTISNEQIAVFSRLYPMNARPIQSASGRLIKQSN